jgi:hypothetical protein
VKNSNAEVAINTVNVFKSKDYTEDNAAIPWERLNMTGVVAIKKKI